MQSLLMLDLSMKLVEHMLNWVAGNEIDNEGAALLVEGYKQARKMIFLNFGYSC